jgi:hypothetical protein
MGTRLLIAGLGSREKHPHWVHLAQWVRLGGPAAQALPSRPFVAASTHSPRALLHHLLRLSEMPKLHAPFGIDTLFVRVQAMRVKPRIAAVFPVPASRVPPLQGWPRLRAQRGANSVRTLQTATRILVFLRPRLPIEPGMPSND